MHKNVSPGPRGLSLMLLLTWTLVGCDEPPAPREEVVRPIKTFTVQENVQRTRTYAGQIAAGRAAELAFEVPGKLVEFPVKEGQEVAENAVLARLDRRDFESDVKSAQAEFDRAAANFRRAAELLEKGFISQREYDELQATRLAAEAGLERARKALADATLRAPFAGYVARKLVDDFANVTAKQPVVILQDGGQLEVVVDVPEADLATAEPGLSLEERSQRIQPRVTVSAAGDRSFPARLTEFSTAPDPATRTYEATLAFDPPEGLNLLPGMSAQVTITVPRREAGARVVPSQAVAFDEQGQAFVWRLDEGDMTVHAQPVAVGPLTGSFIEVTAGLDGGETIAMSGLQQLREGMRVRSLGR